jgi:hypothetical protein
MADKERLEYLPKIGEEVSDVVTSAISMSRENHRPVTIKFNEVVVNVNEDSSSHKVVTKINKEIKKLQGHPK